MAKIDWDKIEVEYRSGVLSIREIARRNGCDDKAIRNKAKKNGWKRNLKDRVKERVREKVAESADKKVRKNIQKSARSAFPSRDATEDEIIDELADEQFRTVKRHKRLASKQQNIVARILNEVTSRMKTTKGAKMNVTLDDAGNISKILKNLSYASGKMMDADRKSLNLDDFTDHAKKVLVILDDYEED